MVERARALLPQAKILSLYGRSENLTTTTCTVDDDAVRSLISDGAAMPFAEVQAVDELGSPVPAGSEGDIAYRGPSHMLGYLGRPDDTAELAGFSRSDDLGVMDADGYVRVTGRTKDIIIRGGMNISVREVEDLLAEHAGIRDAALKAFLEDGAEEPGAARAADRAADDRHGEDPETPFATGHRPQGRAARRRVRHGRIRGSVLGPHVEQ